MLAIRDPGAADENAWRRLWSDYNRFYNILIPESVTKRTWQRINDPKSPLLGRLATIDNLIVGFSVSVLHDSTWTVQPVCYLEDLFVDPQYRRRGCGRLLIKDMVDQAISEGWSRLYWHTRADNPARRLYDQFVLADGFVRDRLIFDESARLQPISST
jgi:ribosomal protein S18 acetylase RimI-like enzyme